MNLQESETEELLRTLRPSAPGVDLERKIGAELATRALAVADRVPAAAVLRRGLNPQSSWWASLRWAFAGALAGAAMIASFEYFSSPSAHVAIATAPAESDTLEHVDASAELVEAQDEGLVLSDSAEPVRRVRFTSYERHVWSNPATGALMEYTVPREDIRLTPVALQ